MAHDYRYPVTLQQKILVQEAPGGVPAMLSVVIPTITSPHKPFEVKIAVLDENCLPSVKYDGTVKLTIAGSKCEKEEISFKAGVPAVGSIRKVEFSEAGVWRINAESGNLQAWSNPTLCTDENIPGIYWGDPHIHTVLSNCHPDRCRSMNFCFTAARYCSMLDWAGAADHVSNGRCDFSKWKEQCTVSNLYSEENTFVTLPGYEASLRGDCGGDNNVYMSKFPDMFVDEYEEGDINTLCGKLGEKLSKNEYFVVPHHTTRTGKHGEIPDHIYPGPDLMPVVEIHSKWGTSEYRGNPNALHDIHPGPSYIVDLLNQGLLLGFIGGTDTHTTMTFSRGIESGHIDRHPGLTAVFCPELTRKNIFEGIKNRNCYAASLERILLHGTVAGLKFGGTIKYSDLKAPPTVDVLVAAKSNISQIDLVRNGENIHTVKPDNWQNNFSYTDNDDLDEKMLSSTHLNKFIYYYLRVTCESGAQAWSSPVWILV